MYSTFSTAPSLVDITKAGDGEMDVQVTNSKSASVNCQLTPIAMGSRYEASFVPVDKQPHKMNITFNNHKIAGSPFLCEIFDNLQIEAFGDGLKLAQVDQTANFFVDLTKEGLDSDVAIKITGYTRRPFWGKGISSGNAVCFK